MLSGRWNQPTPSRTMSNASVYVPPTVGALTIVLMVRDAPEARSVSIDVRVPSHTTAFPAASSQ